MSLADLITESSPEYRSALAYLVGRINYERLAAQTYSADDFKLQPMRRLLDLLGSPEQSIPAIHVAGTKGKGSTSVMIASMLQAGGYRVGLYTSPHRHRFEERMLVNGEPPTPAEIVELVRQLEPVEQQLLDEGISLTFFELTTALGWLHFRQRGAEVAVIEVGLGGRLDSTNLCRPIVTIITSISRDHMRLLGDTLASIAREKAGIAKSGVTMISGVADSEPAAAIREICRAVGAPLQELERDFRFSSCRTAYRDSVLPQYAFELRTPKSSYEELVAPLPGLHQVPNTALAVRAVELAGESGFPVSESAMRDGLRRVELPLRLEVVRSNPSVVVDAAHNDASMQALCDTIRDVPATRRTLVFGSSRDKETRRLLEIAAGAFDRIVVTQYLNNPRAVSPEELLVMASEVTDKPILVASSPAEAWSLVRSDAAPTELICVSGSFFLAAEFRELLLAE
jgi:dihydrofolate synthase/folylpolyglutamate synthase